MSFPLLGDSLRTCPHPNPPTGTDPTHIVLRIHITAERSGLAIARIHGRDRDFFGHFLVPSGGGGPKDHGTRTVNSHDMICGSH